MSLTTPVQNAASSLIWNLSDLDHVKKNGLKVFSCFSCGGGSTMGYKLAGFEVLGCCEIDPKMVAVYKKNHNPKYVYQMGVQDFKKLDNLPDELMNLDILDGSPPCSSFSMAGSREKAWGKNKKFREGQAHQILDDLFFEFIEVANKLRPKVVVAENVKGLIVGNAKGYVKMIFDQFRKAGYETQLFLINSAMMGVPQRRERTFFIARRSDLILPKVHLNFNQEPITVKVAWLYLKDQKGASLGPSTLSWWYKTPLGKSIASIHPKKNRFSWIKIHPNMVAPTQTASSCLMHWQEPRLLSRLEAGRLQTFPDDYNFLDNKPVYVCGMSVPPYMMRGIAAEIAHQFFHV